MNKSFPRITFLMLCLIQFSLINPQTKRDVFCKFTLGDMKSTYQQDLKGSQDLGDGVYSYRYTGILCQSYFEMEISDTELRFKEDKLVYIKATTWINSGQVEIFVQEAIKEYGKPDAIQKEDDVIISKRVWNGSNTWISLTVKKSNIDSGPAYVEVSYAK